MGHWFTVIPLNNLDLSLEARYEFADGIMLRVLPDWVRKGRIIEDLSFPDREVLKNVTHGFFAEYEAASLGDPDLSCKRDQPKSIQDMRYENAVLANLALWLSRPSPVCFSLVFNASASDGSPVVRQVSWHSPLLCHPNDDDAKPFPEDINLSISIHSSLVALPRSNAIWTAVRATWSALQMNIEEVRYSLLWIALEALFGPEDAREITYRMAQRIAFFLTRDRSSSRELFANAKKGYSFRSKVVHGRWKRDPESDALMADGKGLVRRSLVQILQDSELTKKFSKKDREAYLDDLVFSI